MDWNFDSEFSDIFAVFTESEKQQKKYKLRVTNLDYIVLLEW
jgi:hypothetical protein